MIPLTSAFLLFIMTSRSVTPASPDGLRSTRRAFWPLVPDRFGRASMISIIKVLLMKELGHQIGDFEVVKI
jgi:hypothetical protein